MLNLTVTYVVNSTKTYLLIHFICIEIVMVNNVRGTIIKHSTHLYKKI